MIVVGDFADLGHQSYRIFRVNGCLNGMAHDLDILLFHRQGYPGGHVDLHFHQVYSGNHLGNAVLHL